MRIFAFSKKIKFLSKDFFSIPFPFEGKMPKAKGVGESPEGERGL